MATAQQEPAPQTPEDGAVELFEKFKKEYRMYQPWEIKQALRDLPSSAGHIVEGLIGPASVNILVGDSGIGKSPLAYQLALAVASGTPFLGMAARQARVLLVDYENALGDSYFFLHQQRKHLGLKDWPWALLVWPLRLDPFQKHVEAVIRSLSPDLVIIDSLRSLNRRMESASAAAVEQIKRFRLISSSRGAAFLLIHHLHKRGFANLGSLEQAETLDWMLGAAGVRALVNQTDTRLALAKRPSRSEPTWRSALQERDWRSTDALAGKEQGGAALVLRGHFRAHGEIGPVLLRRAWDETGEPLGFERFTPELLLLEDPHQQRVFEQLPGSFMFKDIRRAYGKHEESTNQLIHKLMRLGLVRKIAYGHYEKEKLNGSGRIVDLTPAGSAR